MNRTKSALILLCSLATTAAWAETAQEARVKKLIEPRMGANIKVDSVVKTPYAGLYEVRTNGDIFYTDENADYIVVGKVIDTRTYKDLTKERVDQLAAINFTDLPLDDAIKTVKGNGKRVMAIFEDPNCPYCKNLHKTLQDIDNVTVYTFLLNILSDDSAVKSRDIWCAADRSKAWNEWMVNGKPAAAATAACPTPNDKVLALGKKLRIVGTPTVYFSDGSRTGSALDAKALEQKLASLK
ncbi:MAG: DsbC family protein [Collimonas sp.]|uniref:DsbC family protein n=1 Tax=Collimonas sp. TaxID=1963772 RepID=UPI0032670B63